MYLYVYIFMFMSRRILLKIKHVSGKFVKKKHNLPSLNFYKNRTMCEIMWRNTEESGRSQMTIRRMRVACWTTNATHTHTHTPHTHTHHTHTHKHTHTQTHTHTTHTQTHTHTHTHTHTYRIYNNYCFSTGIIITGMRLNVPFYVYRLYFFIRTMYDPLHNLKL